VCSLAERLTDVAVDRGRLADARCPKTAHTRRLRAGLRGARFNATSRAVGLNQPEIPAPVSAALPPNRRLAMLLNDLASPSSRRSLNGRRIVLAAAVREASQ